MESLRNFALKARTRAFLSHSHLDRDLALGLAEELHTYGVKLYIDWLDFAMLAKTEVATAKRIQEKIKASDYFLFLATENSLSSQWCPWELGYADGLIKHGNIYIVPTEDARNINYGKEYMGLYNVLEQFVSEGKRLKNFGYYPTDGSKPKWLPEEIKGNGI